MMMRKEMRRCNNNLLNSFEMIVRNHTSLPPLFLVLVATYVTKNEVEYYYSKGGTLTIKTKEREIPFYLVHIFISKKTILRILDKLTKSCSWHKYS